MGQKVKFVNLLLVFLTVGGVLQLRMETAAVSYDLSKKSQQLKKYESAARLLGASYEHKVGSERMVSEAGGMVALSAPKAEQVVMIDQTGLAITR